MALNLSITNNQIHAQIDQAFFYIPLTADLTENLQQICQKYSQSHDNQTALLQLGQDLFKQLFDQHNSHIQNWLNSAGSHQLIINSDPQPDENQQLLLNLPWEILAQTDFLAKSTPIYEVIRQIGKPNSHPPAPLYKDLTLAFMAADPNFSDSLNYEAEEAAIYAATKDHQNLNLMVDESGNLSRLDPPYKAVLIYEHYQAINILSALIEAAKDQVDGQALISKFNQNPAQLKTLLIGLLEDCFDDNPIILLVDDLEQHVLVQPEESTTQVPLKNNYQHTFIALIEAFKEADSPSYLLFTSRYPFSLTNDYGKQISNDIDCIEVPDMNSRELEKHWLALLQLQNQARNKAQDQEYLTQIKTASFGNAGLRALLLQALLNNETTALEQALTDIKNYQAPKKNSTQNKDIKKYLERIALEAYYNALTNNQRLLLTLFGLFDFAIPRQVILQAAPFIGIEDATPLLARLNHLGLLNQWDEEGLEDHLSCCALTQKIITPFSSKERNELAQDCALLLWENWFEDFLAIHQIPKTNTLKGSALYAVENKIDVTRALDQKRISLLCSFCLQHSLIDWQAAGTSKEDFFDLLELSVSINSFHKLIAAAEAIIFSSNVQSKRFNRLTLAYYYIFKVKGCYKRVK